MNAYKFIAIALTVFSLIACSEKTVSSSLETKTELINGIASSTFKVWGNCEMCKETIESSLKVEGVSAADWDRDTKMISITYDDKKISLDQIQKNIAAVGYDNVKYKGNDTAYNNLAECCQYERK